jgi:hypothetical protein
MIFLDIVSPFSITYVDYCRLCPPGNAAGQPFLANTTAVLFGLRHAPARANIGNESPEIFFKKLRAFHKTYTF